jgi:transcription elongation GreA/GreB family factor
MKPDRSAILAQCRLALESRRAEYLRELESLDQASAAETKSSAGDKYETAREMFAQARALVQRNLSETAANLEALDRMAAAPMRDKVGFGSLVETNLGWYLIGAGLGETETGGTVRLISLASPMGIALKGQGAGDRVPWRGGSLEILQVPVP